MKASAPLLLALLIGAAALSSCQQPERHGASRPVSAAATDYVAGDLVTWRLPGNLPHIGIVSDRKAWGSDRLLVLHNIGRGTSEDDILMSYPITGHYRFYAAKG